MMKVALETGSNSTSITSDSSIRLSQISSSLIDLQIFETWINIVTLQR